MMVMMITMMYREVGRNLREMFTVSSNSGIHYVLILGLNEN